MLISQEEIGTPQAEAMGRLSYSGIAGFEYHADLDNCSNEVLTILDGIDKDMASFPDMNMPHTIDNWREIESMINSAS